MSEEMDAAVTNEATEALGVSADTDKLPSEVTLERSPEMTSEDKEAQRRSFAHGNVSLHNPDVTPEVVAEAARELALEDANDVSPSVVPTNVPQALPLPMREVEAPRVRSRRVEPAASADFLDEEAQFAPFPSPPSVAAAAAAGGRPMFAAAAGGYVGGRSDVSAPTTVGGPVTTAGQAMPVPAKPCTCFCGACKVADHKNCSHIDPCGAVSGCGCRCGACKNDDHKNCSHINSCAMKAGGGSAAAPASKQVLGNIFDEARKAAVENPEAMPLGQARLLPDMGGLVERVTALELRLAALSPADAPAPVVAATAEGASREEAGQEVDRIEATAKAAVRFARPSDLLKLARESLDMLEERLCGSVGATEERSTVLLEIGEAREALSGLEKQVELITQVVRAMATASEG